MLNQEVDGSRVDSDLVVERPNTSAIACCSVNEGTRTGMLRKKFRLSEGCALPELNAMKSI